MANPGAARHERTGELKLRQVAMLVAGSALLASAPGCENTAMPAHRTTTLYVALGDSIGAGVGASSVATGYVARLLSHYRSELGVTRLLNRSVSGETAASIRTSGQLERALGEIHGSSDTRAVTIDIGVNDLPTCRGRWSSCPFRRNLSATLAQLRGALDRDPGAETFVAMAYYNPASGLGGTGPSGESFYDRALLGRDARISCDISTGSRVGLNDVIFQEARRRGAQVADPYPAFKRDGQSLLAADRLHPSNAGHAAIAAAFRTPSSRCLPHASPGSDK
jgi:lysophospholipase L1-like esterase